MTIYARHYERYRWRESGLERTVMGNDLAHAWANKNGSKHALLPCALVRLPHTKDQSSNLSVYAHSEDGRLQGELDCETWLDINWEQRKWMPSIQQLIQGLCKHMNPILDESMAMQH